MNNIDVSPNCSTATSSLKSSPFDSTTKLQTNLFQINEDARKKVSKVLQFDFQQDIPFQIPKMKEFPYQSSREIDIQVVPLVTSKAFSSIVPESTTIKVEKKRELECKYCLDTDDISFMVRPCFCKGSIQYVHQKCLQREVEINYMNQEREKFFGCQLCKHPFTFKIYQTYSYSQAISPPNMRNFIVYNTVFIAAISALIELIYQVSRSIKNQPYLQSYAFFMFIIGCLLSFGIILKLLSSIISLMTKFEWKILDREQSQIKDEGQIVNQFALMGLINYFKFRHSQKQQTLV